MMAIGRAALMGVLTWAMMMSLDFHREVSIAMGIFAAFLTESTIQSSKRAHLKHKASHLQNELNIAIGELSHMKRALDNTTSELREALDELHRRDAIGSPAARELLARQEEAVKAQKKAIDLSASRSVETLESLERMIISQGEQTARVQEVLSAVLEKLALSPRQNINMKDSVLTQENNSTPTMSDDILAMMG